MEMTKSITFSDDEKYALEGEDYDDDDLSDIDTMNFLESLDNNMPYSKNHNLQQSENNCSSNFLPSTSKMSMISETQTTANFIREFENFYSEMMGKVNTLKNTPALHKSNFTEKGEIDEENLYSNLKQTAEVQEQLNYIKKLDDEIKSVISDYHLEKTERLQTQIEMCNEITKNNTLPERDTELFLNLCEFEFSDAGNADKNKREEPETIKKPKPVGTRKPNDFIMRNIYLAKEGVFANSSLTDEEKVKLEDILQYDVDKDIQEHPQRFPFTLPSSGNSTSNYFANAYSVSQDEKKQIEEIDFELEKFKLDERKSEKDLASKEEFDKQNSDNKNNFIKSKDEIEKMNEFLLEKHLKKLEAKLKELRDAEEADLETLRLIKEEANKNKSTDNNLEDDENFEIGNLLDLENLDFDEKELEDINLEDSQREATTEEKVDLDKKLDEINLENQEGSDAQEKGNETKDEESPIDQDSSSVFSNDFE